ncbi:hypothetical protein ACHHYP_07458 [Achlya hypogyna]|uniref:CS domain-containing protein n=1 Tax=Achlya hypogyna TaxID=1202772 RepID=A0A1V9ZLW1_ACHHY|nr:hypothetical protein ACHHYP_07458 [Achlya hypogyna]
MTQQSTLWAPVKWAQRADSLYVTIDLPDVKSEKVTLTNSALTFAGSSNGQQYAVTLEFLHEVDTAATESKWATTARNVHFYILKKDKEAPFWPHLLKDKALEKTNVKVDWNKYVDEDDDDEQGFDMSALSGGGGFDINQMMAQQGAGMPDGMDDEDSDDEDLPDLEE